MGALGGGSARVKSILASLREDDEGQQLTGLTELCEYISISSEDAMMSFPTEQVVPLLVSFLGADHNPDIMLLAARALTFLADVFPPSAVAIIRHGAVPAFCSRLLAIEYIDLAEQSLQALEKLSHEHPGSLMRAGALVAVLSYVDFFQTGVQRVAAATAANICRGLTTEHVDAVSTAAPILINLLRYPDAKIVDSACLALTRIADVFAKSPTHMEMLCNFGLINSIVEMVAVSETGSIASALSANTFYGLVKLLSTCAAASHIVAEALLTAGISSTIRKLLATSPLLASSTASPGNVLRSADQLQDLVSLAAHLLPPVADARVAFLTENKNENAKPTGGGEQACALTAYLKDNPSAAEHVAADLLPAMLQVYSASAAPNVKRDSLSAIIRMLYHAPVEALSELLADIPVSSLVEGLLRSQDVQTAALGMQMAEVLMDKLPEVFVKYFLKEGVVHAMEELSAHATPSRPTSANASNSGSGGILTRRRSRAAEHADAGTGANATHEQASERPTTLGDVRTPGGALERSTLGVHARRFLARHFMDKRGQLLGCDTEGVRALKHICARLPHPDAIKDMFAALSASGDAEVSTFELLSSGVLHTLRAYLQGEDLQQDAGIDEEDRKWKLLERLGAFADVSLAPGTGASPPMLVLVKKLQAALAAAEHFPLHLIVPGGSSVNYGGLYGYGGFPGRSALARSVSSGSNSLAAGLLALSNPFKVRLARASDVNDDTLKDYGNNVVLIEPLATLSQVEDFLWQRVKPSRVPQQRQQQPADRQQQTAPRGREGASGPCPGASEARPPGSAGGAPRGNNNKRDASQGRPIPQPNRRMTRAQARAAAEAEVEAQRFGSDDDAEPMDATKTNEPSPAAAGTTPPDAPALPRTVMDGLPPGMSPAEDGRDLGHFGSDDEHDGFDIDEDEDAYVEDDMYDDEEADMMDAAAMRVHDMHLAEEELSVPGSHGASPARWREGGQGPSSRGRGGGGAAAGADNVGGHRSYAGAAAASLGRGTQGEGERRTPRLAFYVDGHLVDTSTTIFQAVQQWGSGSSAAAARNAAGVSEGSRLWRDTHTITYALYEDSKGRNITNAGEGGSGGGQTPSAATETDLGSSKSVGPTCLGASALVEFLSPPEVITAGAAALADASVDCKNALALLSVIEALNRLTPQLHAALEARKGQLRSPTAPPFGHVPRDALISGRLGPKAAQQMKNYLAIFGGALPTWCGALAMHARFLLPFETRRQHFYCTAFGIPRALLFLQQSQAAEQGPSSAAERDAASSFRAGRISRQKVRLSRRRILESAHKVFEEYAGAKSMLEVEFFHEAGSGLGPTLEFYTLLSHELQRRSLGMWREDNTAREEADDKAALTATTANAILARTISGPGPLRGELPNEAQPTIAGDHEHLQGPRSDGGSANNADLVVAPLGLFPRPLAPGSARDDGSSTVARHFRLLGRVVAKALQDCRLLDLPLSPVFYRLAMGRPVGLFDLRAVDAGLGASLERLHASACAAATSGCAATVDGCSVEDLCLTFVYPGQEGWELRPGGADTPVTSSNLDDYIKDVVDATLGSGIAMQVQAFRTGFESIFSLSALASFYEDELEAMLCGTGETWTTESLASVIKFDHGYTNVSPQVIALLEVLAELDAVDQRRFLRFVTGSPRLPPGGLAALQPRLTVVRKLSAAMMAAAASGPEGEPGTSAPTGSFQSERGGSFTTGSAGSALARSAADGDLPSVMTCANYLKLPPYSCKEVVKERLLFAIREGQGSFDLS
jgi:E3 ubiquitin-protein ligase TRIP12